MDLADGSTPNYIGFFTVVYGVSMASKIPVFLFLAIAGAFVGSISFATGFALWPVDLFLLVTYPGIPTRRRVQLVAIWLTVVAIAITTFLGVRTASVSAIVPLDSINNFMFVIAYMGVALAYFSRDLGNILQDD